MMKLKLTHAKKTLLLSKQHWRATNEKEPDEIRLRKSTYVDNMFPIDLEITNKSRDGVNNTMMHLFVNIEAESSWDVIVTEGSRPEDPLVYDKQWLHDVEFWSFSLVILRFYDTTNECLFTKYLHLDGEMMECGCSSDTTEHFDYCYLMDDQHHKSSFTCFFDSIFTISQIMQCSGSIEVKAEFYTGAKIEADYWSERKRKTKQTRKVNGDDSNIIFQFIDSEDILKGHKEIVSAESGMLKSMLESGMLEAQTGVIPVALDWVTKDMFEDFLTGLYGGWDIKDMEETHLNFELQFNRLRLTDYYECPHQHGYVIGLIVGNSDTDLDMKISLDIYLAGCQYRNTCLKFRALQWIGNQKSSRSYPSEDALREMTKDIPGAILQQDHDVLFNALNMKKLPDV